MWLRSRGADWICGPAIKRAVPPKGPTQVQAMITNAMRASLTDLGYSDADIASSVPERARVIVDYDLRRPSSKSLPPEWTRRGQHDGGASAVLSKLSSAVSLAAVSLVMLAAACALEPTLECGTKWAHVQRWLDGVMMELAPIQRFFQREWRHAQRHILT